MNRTFASAVALLVCGTAMAQSPLIPAPTISKGGGASEQLPQPAGKGSLDKLKSSRSDLRLDRDETPKSGDSEETAADVERREMRKRLDDLLKKMDNRTKLPPPESKSPPKNPNTNPTGSETRGGVVPPPETPATTDALLLAQSLYRSGEFETALKAFRMIDLSAYPREDKAFINYMTACCLRRTGKLSEAASMFRVLTSPVEDEFVAECALWQIGSIRMREDMEKQLAQLKKRREAMDPK